MKYQELTEAILKGVGGKENITELTRCTTRLRFVLKDHARIEMQALESLPGIVGIFKDSDRFQIVIGSNVGQVYEEMTTLLPEGFVKRAEKAAGTYRFIPGRILTMLAETIAGVFLPVTTAIIGVCMITSIRILMVTLGALDPSGDLHALMVVFGDSAFYFLPILVAVGAAERFKCNKFVAMAIMGIVLHPTLVAMINSGANSLNLGGFHIYLFSYSSSIIPAILSVYVLSKFEKLASKILPSFLHPVLLAFIEIAVAGFVVVAFIGPAGLWVNNTVAGAYFFLLEHAQIPASLAMGAFYPLLVFTGTHNGLLPIMIESVNTLGRDYIMALWSISNTATAGAAFAVFLKTKNSQIKSTAGSAAFLCAVGLTEPALFGVTLRFKKPLIASIIAGGLGGIGFGAFKVASSGIGFSPLGSIPMYLGPTFVPFAIITALTFVLSCGIAYVVGFADVAETKPAAMESKKDGSA
jgi:PTS system beta-glucosides-specific IIC component